MKIVHALEPAVWINFINAYPHGQIFLGDEEANRYIDQPMRAPWCM